MPQGAAGANLNLYVITYIHIRRIQPPGIELWEHQRETCP